MKQEKPKNKERAIIPEKPKKRERANSVEKPIKGEREMNPSLTHMVDAALAIEKIRVATEVRQSHLAKRHKHDPETDELHQRIKDLEVFVDGRVAHLIESHPAYPWFSLVKGVGGENIAKVVGLIDITKAPTISSLWKFAGFAPDEEGKAMRRVKGGGKLEYNSQLRSMCWRLASSLKRIKGNFYQYYIQEKDKYTERFLNQGYKILPTPQGKWVCTNCGASWGKKRDITPCCDKPAIEKKLREEPPGVIWLGHLDMMALRKMIKMFLACLWLVWREAEGLPITAPYAIEKLGHSKLISPWEMVDSEPEMKSNL